MQKKSCKRHDSSPNCPGQRAGGVFASHRGRQAVRRPQDARKTLGIPKWSDKTRPLPPTPPWAKKQKPNVHVCVCTHRHTHTHTHGGRRAQGWADTAGKPGGGGRVSGLNSWLHPSFKAGYLTAARQAPLRVVIASTSQSAVRLKADSKDNVC